MGGGNDRHFRGVSEEQAAEEDTGGDPYYSLTNEQKMGFLFDIQTGAIICKKTTKTQIDALSLSNSLSLPFPTIFVL